MDNDGELAGISRVKRVIASHALNTFVILSDFPRDSLPECDIYADMITEVSLEKIFVSCRYFLDDFRSLNCCRLELQQGL